MKGVALSEKTGNDLHLPSGQARRDLENCAILQATKYSMESVETKNKCFRALSVALTKKCFAN